MNIEGKRTTIQASPQKLFDFLSDFNHYEQLMPEQIVNWKSEKDTCSFTVKGMADLSLKFGKKQAPELLELVPDGKSPVQFTLTVKLEPDTLNEQNAVVQANVDADLNPMLAMFARKPLENLANTITEELKKVFP
ncbi:MAG: hypothetical protein JXR71_01895 [Bacteroidales bacterium]|nr:hypothetical protein [Bacteroidales bacterium]